MVRDLADSILADPRYDRPGESLPDRILRWFGEQLGKVFGSLVGSGAGTLVAWVVVVAAVAFVVFLIVRFGRLGRLPSGPVRTARVMVELTRTPAEWRAEAEALEAQGRWKEGLRCRHRSLIASLVGQGVIPEQAGRTAREHVSDVARSRPDATDSLEAATDLFEVAWYGDAPTGPDEARRFDELSERVLHARADA